MANHPTAALRLRPAPCQVPASTSTQVRQYLRIQCSSTWVMVPGPYIHGQNPNEREVGHTKISGTRALEVWGPARTSSITKKGEQKGQREKGSQSFRPELKGAFHQEEAPNDLTVSPFPLVTFICRYNGIFCGARQDPCSPLKFSLKGGGCT